MMPSVYQSDSGSISAEKAERAGGSMANEPNYSSNPSKDEPKKKKVRVIPLEYIDEFPGHPFKVLDDESMQMLMNSIEEIGVQSPIVARIKEDQRYEIISGHRRVHACRRLGLKLIPAIVRDLSRDEAIIATEPSSVNSTASGTTSIRSLPSSTVTDLWMNRCSGKRSLPYNGWKANLHAPLHRRADGGHGNLECQGQCGKGPSLCCEPGKDMERTVCGSGKVPHGGEDIGV